MPKKKNLMVATGGSGHGFKYLPVLGKYVVDIIEGKEDGDMGTELRKRWMWRSLGAGEKAYNVIGEGKYGERTLAKQVLVKDEELAEAGSGLSSKL